MKIALLMGSFNPIHKGHISLAKFVLERGLADGVCCVVSPQNPLKEVANVSFEDRLRMVEIAFEGCEGVVACDIEMGLGLPSYTFNTITELKKRYQSDDFFILCGSDIVEQLDRWYRIEELKKLVEFKVYPRGEGDFSSEFSDAELFDVSSTDLRGEISEDWLPRGVYEYIIEHNLYVEGWSAMCFYDRGVYLYGRGEFGGALNALNKALEIDAHFVRAQEMVALINDILAYRNTDMYNP